jgi:hypothetical protein
MVFVTEGDAVLIAAREEASATFITALRVSIMTLLRHCKKRPGPELTLVPSMWLNVVNHCNTTEPRVIRSYALAFVVRALAVRMCREKSLSEITPTAGLVER